MKRRRRHKGTSSRAEALGLQHLESKSILKTFRDKEVSRVVTVPVRQIAKEVVEQPPRKIPLK